jgi:hypothetical protein
MLNLISWLEDIKKNSTQHKCETVYARYGNNYKLKVSYDGKQFKLLEAISRMSINGRLEKWFICCDKDYHELEKIYLGDNAFTDVKSRERMAEILTSQVKYCDSIDLEQDNDVVKAISLHYLSEYAYYGDGFGGVGGFCTYIANKWLYKESTRLLNKFIKKED